MRAINDFDIINKVGTGSFGEVFKVRRKKDGQIYAMKRVKMGMLKEKDKENALNEVRILASLRHKNIIGYKDAIFDEENNILCIIMEYAESGDIQKAIKEKIKKQQHFPEESIWKALIQMTEGLKALHSRKILHRDLKCANVFLSSDGTCKLGDLNVSKVAKRGLVYTQTGTPYYASPEVWRDEPYDNKSDIWSLGCVIYEMAALKPPFVAKDMAGLFLKIQQGTFPPIPSRYSSALQQIIQKLLRMSPSLRPDCEWILLNRDVMNHNIYEPVAIQNDSQLLETIKLPKNLIELNNKLPAQNYEDSYKLEIIKSQSYKPSIEMRADIQRKVNQMYQEQQDQILYPDVKIKLSKPPVRHTIFSPITMDDVIPQQEDQKRLERIRSVREDPINGQNNRQQMLIQFIDPIPRPVSHYFKHREAPKNKDDASLVIQLNQKQRRLIQPFQKQLSHQTPIKGTPLKEGKDIILSNLPYLCNYDQHLKNKSEREKENNLMDLNKRKVSPFERPKVVLPFSSPFQLERRKKNQQMASIIPDSHFFN